MIGANRIVPAAGPVHPSRADATSRGIVGNDFRILCSTAYRWGQFLKQCPGILQVSGVKPLGEPAVDWGQQPVGFGPLALPLPQPTQAHGRP